ncbi:uncharacterized protein K460DRAFT_404820 [Cucurbitaria berberidis CBS 394.84]|uniref:Secreted protein n=1 Tax=Cucurbitaria berberidis CBS 394.84 TaxID=1168544 RepID=A0A9P4GG25_9PLEO|nr:uncharacterized protein K460DRAFT_404820 [Cucurbitaria berberidis CBS 394.84]KAF1844525.1 hypothetical protein K460DRAFT_404820 [Cucurbitaria berberidis CBS 394.84]
MQLAYLTLLVLYIYAVAADPCPANMGLPGGVYICSDKNFTGQCTWMPPRPACRYFDGFHPTSIGPDPGGYCLLWRNHTCEGEAISFWFGKVQAEKLYCPGSGDVPRGVQVGSFRCFAGE